MCIYTIMKFRLSDSGSCSMWIFSSALAAAAMGKQKVINLLSTFIVFARADMHSIFN